MATSSLVVHSGEYRIVGASSGLSQADPYRAAMDFVRGRIWVEGDLVAAVKAYKKEVVGSAFSSWLERWLVRISQSPAVAWFHGKTATAGDIRYHYDRSNDFYRQFLDSRMVYSCAYFREAETPLDEAQFAKLDLICRKLDMQPGDRLLDIGCGWGALLVHAVENYDAQATGCTLSKGQAQYAADMIRARGLMKSGTVRERDYRDVDGVFDKVASVGMFEHVGRSRLVPYFTRVRSLLKRDGLFLNHGIVRRGGSKEDGESLFLQKKVFPGTALVGLGDVLDAAESAGFEVLDVENLRPSYALTCRAWVERLQRNVERCRALVDEEIYRTWLLYLAGSAVNFEEGYLDIHQMLLAPKDSAARPLTREPIIRKTLRLGED